MLDTNKDYSEDSKKETKKVTKAKKTTPKATVEVAEDKVDLLEEVVEKPKKSAKKATTAKKAVKKVSKKDAESEVTKVEKIEDEVVKEVKKKTTTKKKVAVKVAPEPTEGEEQQEDEVVKEEIKKKPTAKKAPKKDVKESEKTIEVSDTDKVVEEIENKVAEEAEKDDEKNSIPMLAYADMELEALTEELQKLLKEHPVQQLKANIDTIKNAFNTKFGALLAEKKAAFLADGGDTIDFQYSNPVKTTYNSLLSEYKTKRDAYYAALDQQLKGNLETRHTVINELKELISDADTKTMYKVFLGLQNRWRAIGPVPRNKYNDTWRNYHHHVERFYDLLHLSNDFRDLDFKHNLEEKIKLIERVEALAERDDVNETFKELQELHKLWKEDIGPVSREYREEIWHKFSTASKKIHDKRHDYFRGLRSQYQVIIDKKIAVSVAIANYDTSGNKKHSDWRKSIKDIEDLRQGYFNAGKLPYSKSEEVWQQFKEATRKFNHAKNLFYKNEKSSQHENLDKKNALITLAESLKDSEDWENATNTMKKIQADWKKIGHVPRKFSDDIWKKFKGACNYYFERLHVKQGSFDKEQQVLIDQKKAFLEEVKSMKTPTVEAINIAIETWRGFGELPKNVRHIESKFNKQVDYLYGSLSLENDEIALLKFKNMVDSYVVRKDFYKLDSEQLFVRKKIDESNKEIQQLENNLSFFSGATKDNPLVKNVHENIEKYKANMEIWKNKLVYLKKLKY